MKKTDAKTADKTSRTPLLVSRCLLDTACRYDGRTSGDLRSVLETMGFEPVSVCPESDGGLPTPRPASEVQCERSLTILKGEGRIVNTEGADVTAEFISGAKKALLLARETGATAAVLKSKSPSCGKGLRYDGTFSGTKTADDGLTTALLLSEGIEVFTEHELDDPRLATHLRR